MRVLFLASRELTGAMTGRKQVLRTILESLAANGCEVYLAAFRADAAEHLQALSKFGVREVLPLQRPGMFGLAWNLFWRCGVWGWSANEGLFYSTANLKALQQFVREAKIDFIVCDMLRLAPYAASLRLPWHLDLDDLLSQRYRTLASGGQSNDQLLGFYSHMLPSVVRRLAGWLGRCVLPWEARRIEQREAMWSRTAASVSLVSPREADVFSQRLGIAVMCLPMRAQFPPENFVRPPMQRSLVFLGGLDYQPNLDALRYYRDQIQPALRAEGLGDVPLTMIGKAPDAARREFATAKGITLQGYVDDLSTELCRHAVFIAPITHGTGVKTKVLDALGHGLPIVTTTKGIEGIGIEHGQHCLAADSPAELAACVKRLLSDPEFAAELAQAGEHHVRQHFSAETLRARWQAVLAPHMK